MSENQIYAGIDIGGTNIKFGLFNKAGEILYQDKKPTMAQKGRAPLLNLLKNIGEILLLHADEEEFDVKYLGVGSPGAVNHQTGQVVGPCPNIDDWTGVELGKELNEYLNIPVHVDNDGNSMALAELHFGAAKGALSVICATVGTGIGGGVIVDGKIFHGYSSSAGELGHMIINFDGPECACGNRGCIEAYCSSKYIISSTKAMLNNQMPKIYKEILEDNLDNLTIKKLFTAAKANDEIALKIIENTARYLGIGLAGIMNLLNPEIVVIGGGITDGGAGFVEKVAENIKKYAFFSAVEKLKVRKAELGNQAGFIGAGLLGEYNS